MTQKSRPDLWGASPARAALTWNGDGFSVALRFTTKPCVLAVLGPLSMKRFRCLPALKQKQLREQFHGFDRWPVTEVGGVFEQFAVSVFDHWLSEEEAYKELNDVPSGVQFQYDARLHRFACAVASELKAYLVKWKGRQKQIMTFREFTSAQARDKCLEPLPYRCSMYGRFVVVLPEIDAAYVEGWDFTHHISFRNRSKAAALERLALEHGLFVL